MGIAVKWRWQLPVEILAAFEQLSFRHAQLDNHLKLPEGISLTEKYCSTYIKSVTQLCKEEVHSVHGELMVWLF